MLTRESSHSLVVSGSWLQTLAGDRPGDRDRDRDRDKTSGGRVSGIAAPTSVIVQFCDYIYDVKRLFLRDGRRTSPFWNQGRSEGSSVQILGLCVCHPGCLQWTVRAGKDRGASSSVLVGNHKSRLCKYQGFPVCFWVAGWKRLKGLCVSFTYFSVHVCLCPIASLPDG
jgi:hypothetical protein